MIESFCFDLFHLLEKTCFGRLVPLIDQSLVVFVPLIQLSAYPESGETLHVQLFRYSYMNVSSVPGHSGSCTTTSGGG